jgi:hypothetical protein
LLTNVLVDGTSGIKGETPSLSERSLNRMYVVYGAEPLG